MGDGMASGGGRGGGSGRESLPANRAERRRDTYAGGSGQATEQAQYLEAAQAQGNSDVDDADSVGEAVLPDATQQMVMGLVYDKSEHVRVAKVAGVAEMASTLRSKQSRHLARTSLQVAMAMDGQESPSMVKAGVPGGQIRASIRRSALVPRFVMDAIGGCPRTFIDLAAVYPPFVGYWRWQG